MRICLLLAGALTGCDNGGYQANPVPPASLAPPPPPLPLSFAVDAHAHHRGEAVIGEISYVAEGLITVDGDVRITIMGPGGGAYANSGAGLWGDDMLPGESRQFVGRIESTDGDRGYGNGVVIEQNCQNPDSGRFCDEPAAAEINLTALPAGYGVNLVGEIQITTSDGEETWLLDIGENSYWYDYSIRPQDPFNQWVERLAPFAQDEAVVINIDDARQIFFQSADSGCTGNGIMSPHLDGNYYVFDVSLSIENCNADFAFLNAAYSGLATETQDNYWAADSWLLMFLSTPNGSSPAALTMYASPIY
jgi:hypothetical protein